MFQIVITKVRILQLCFQTSCIATLMIQDQYLKLNGPSSEFKSKDPSITQSESQKPFSWKYFVDGIGGKAKAPYLSTPAESTPESSPVKICFVKLLPGEKRLDFLPPRQYCITYFPPEKIPNH